jgi:signal transduction histidine kinase
MLLESVLLGREQLGNVERVADATLEEQRGVSTFGSDHEDAAAVRARDPGDLKVARLQTWRQCEHNPSISKNRARDLPRHAGARIDCKREVAYCREAQSEETSLDTEPSGQQPAQLFDARGVVDALPFAAMVVGADDIVVLANQDALSLFAASPGKKFNELDASYLVPGLQAALESVRAGGPEQTFTDVAWSVTGREVHLELTLAPTAGSGDAAGGVLLSAVDRSELLALRSELEALRAEHGELLAEHEAGNDELHALNEELRDANEGLRAQIQRLAAAEEADARKNQFLAMLAHELRNPLAAVVNALHVIRKSGATDQQISQAVRIADRQLRHEARLLDDLLDVSRIVLGKISVQAEQVDLRDCVRTALEAASFAISSRALRLDVELPPEPLVVIGDATRLAQCVGNLVSNAIKFTPPGGTVGVSARRQDGHALIAVRDSGAGIAPEILPRVFELFVQGDPSLGRSQGGLGIGLTLVRHLVQLHGGTVMADSAGPGQGSRFEIRLPLTGRAASPSMPDRLTATRPRRILLVEDNRDAREMLRAVLELQGHVVSETGDGVAAVRLATQMRPDVVILDIGLPGVDGFETARRIRRRLGERVRLVAVSGYGDDEARERGRGAGFDAHLVKPVSPEALSETLDAL